MAKNKNMAEGTENKGAIEAAMTGTPAPAASNTLETALYEISVNVHTSSYPFSLAECKVYCRNEADVKCALKNIMSDLYTADATDENGGEPSLLLIGDTAILSSTIRSAKFDINKLDKKGKVIDGDDMWKKLLLADANSEFMVTYMGDDDYDDDEEDDD